MMELLFRSNPTSVCKQGRMDGKLNSRTTAFPFLTDYLVALRLNYGHELKWH